MSTAVLGRPGLGVRYIESLQARARRSGDERAALVVEIPLNAMIRHWREPPAGRCEPLIDAHHRLLARGEVSWALAARFLSVAMALYSGAPLPGASAALHHPRTLAIQHRDTHTLPVLAGHEHAVAALRGEAHPADRPALSEGDGDIAADHHALSALFVALFLQDTAAAWRAAQLPLPGLRKPIQGIWHMAWRTWRAIAALRAARAGLISPRAARRLARPGRWLRRWCQGVPERRYRLMWIEAADLVLRGRTHEALPLFEQAIDLARQLGTRHDAALIAEHAAEAALDAGQRRLHGVFWDEALAGYRQWGATAKVAALEAQMPEAVQPALSTSTSTVRSARTSLDLETVLRAPSASSTPSRPWRGCWRWRSRTPGPSAAGCSSSEEIAGPSRPAPPRHRTAAPERRRRTRRWICQRGCCG